MIRRKRKARRGFTLTELVATIGVFSIVGYSLSGAVDLAHRAQATVSGTVDQNVAVRRASATLRGELKSTSDARVTVTTLGDGNHEVTFQVPVEVAGVRGWGAFERRLGPLEAHQNVTDGAVRYTVELSPNDGVRRLVRQVLDAGGVVRRREVLVRSLAAGGGTAPGFAVEQVGALWRVRITQDRDDGAPRTEEFHVRTRNV